MNIGRLGKIGIVVVIILAGVTYGTYAMSYQGNYDVNVSFSIGVVETGVVAITEFEYESEPTSVLSFWELRGKSGAPITGTYTVYAEWNQTGELETKVLDVVLTDIVLSEATQDTEVSFSFFNKAPGEAQLRLYVVFAYIDSMIYDNTYDVIVG